MFRRYGFKWTIPETLQLQREYELLNLPIQDIAYIHKRSEKAILFKVEKEGFNIDHTSSYRVCSTSLNLGTILTFSLMGICLVSSYVSNIGLKDFYPI
uniref:Uncharacterized protein n=1 Tax=viral metagenome TaxID=1070528 RepID=A0A6C0CPP4_9ZZZZ